METINEEHLGSELRAVIRRAQQTQQSVEITDDRGKIIAYLMPASNTMTPQNEQLRTMWANIDKLSEQLEPYLPPAFDAVEAVRDIRR